MPKQTRYVVLWSQDHGGYELVERGTERRWPIREDQADWLDWLDTHRSFSFYGRAGRLNLLKESRNSGGAGYWYAYRRGGLQIHKRYVGRSADVTVLALEQIAAALNPTMPDPTSERVPQPADGVPQPKPVAAQQAAVPVPSPSSQIPILIPKLQPPRLHGDVIRRERLLAKLDAGLPGKLTLVSAPAGFGKTTLVRQWVAERAASAQFPAVAWVLLDPDDNDPLRFWRYVMTACQSFVGHVPGEAVALLQIPAHLPFKQSPLEAAITALLNQLAQAKGGILVLEDYHVISSPQIHETLMFLLEHLPPMLHLLIISRHDLPLPLIRLSAAGDVCRIDPGDLRFSTEEVHRFLQQTIALPVNRELIELLETRVEGWAVGLRLLAQAVGGQSDPRRLEASLRSFAGTHHSIQEYFVSEVLNHQPPAVQRFLLETSMLGRLNASLCDAVTGTDTSADLLSRMDRGNVLLEPLDEANIWYRYHALFAAAMQQEARRRLGGATLRELARRAADWYHQHTMPFEAVEAALQADDLAQAAALIGQIIGTHPLINGPHILLPGYHTLGRWLARIPQATLAAQPRLLLVQATALLFTFSLDMLPLTEAAAAQIDQLLERAEQEFGAADDRAGQGEVFAFRSMILRQRGEFGRAAEWASKALDLLPTDDLGGRSISLNAIGFLEMSSGWLDRAERSIRAAGALCELIGNPVYVRANNAMLGWVFFEQGKLYAAEAQLARVLAEAREQGDTDDIARSLHALAEIAYEWNDLGLARRRIEESVGISQHFGHVYEIHLAGMQLLARVEWARGQTDAARERFAALRERAQSYQTSVQYATYRDSCMWQAWFHLSNGELGAARRLIALMQPWPEQSLFQREAEQRMHARLLMAEDKPAEALALLRRSVDSIEVGAGDRVALQTRVLLALAHAVLRQTEEARRLLSDVLAQAYSEGYMRLFLDEGRVMAELLHSLLPSVREKHLSAYVRQILHAFAARQTSGATAGSAFAEPLSPQEGRVLQLLGQGYSNPEIARELVVSINTVKAHLKNIYRKLGVSNRLQAGTAARALEGR
ncbi:MAG TPA: LuxR C-terminal-related transcriptional regulator [Roseiflexaceae bacterium]|nr:LuxR C-terminal-related transcriptional regulator [Roseiflexaceae bacterium]